jgi:thioredoxin-like negative regulator of GroEL
LIRSIKLTFLVFDSKLKNHSSFLLSWIEGILFFYLGHSNHLTPLQLEGLLTEEPTTRFWLVEFRTSFSGTCIEASSVLPELSNIYSNKNISFGIIDLGHFPNAAAKFGISMWDHLPTYILFDKATEVARFPEIMNESKVFVPKITKKLLCQHFDLDRRLIEYLSR